MDNQEFAEELKKIILPVLEEEGIELVEFNLVRARGSALLKLLVDRNGGGISLGDCSRLNQKIGDIMDQGDIMRDRYLLEVSSPGLDRPLTSKKDFLRSMNKQVKFFLNHPINGKIEFNGLIRQVMEDSVIIENNSQTIQIPLSKVTKAKQIIK